MGILHYSGRWLVIFLQCQNDAHPQSNSYFNDIVAKGGNLLLNIGPGPTEPGMKKHTAALMKSVTGLE